MKKFKTKTLVIGGKKLSKKQKLDSLMIKLLNQRLLDSHNIYNNNINNQKQQQPSTQMDHFVNYRNTMNDLTTNIKEDNEIKKNDNIKKKKNEIINNTLGDLVEGDNVLTKKEKQRIYNRTYYKTHKGEVITKQKIKKWSGILGL
jgi:hypothetical protein